ncbi:Na+/Pi symporter [Chytridiales sp. JEL 0842]|nr:Na+/Pi symporter [Chytridiales sp. JEL 0842]
MSLPAGSFTWVFAVTVCFAVLDAYAIGANDVANAFATSVGSRSLKLWQAVVIAIFTEFGGAIALGAATTGTIRDGIIQLSAFKDRQDLLMSAFMCALIGSSTWVMLATRFGWPVSTTHSIVGAIIGVGVSAYGSGTVNWGWDGKGVAQIATSWIISPMVAGILGSIIYLLTRQFVFKARDSLKAGIYAIPVYFTVTTFIVSFYVVSKNGKTTLEIKPKYTGGPLTMTGDVALAFGAMGGVTAFVFLFTSIFMAPFFYRRLVKEERLAWYHMFYIWLVPTQPHDESLNMWLKQTLTPHVLDEVHSNTADSATTTTHTMEDKINKEATAVTVVDSIPVAPKDDHHAMIASQTALNDMTPVDMLRSVKEKSVNFVTNLKKGILMDVASVQSESAKKSHQTAVLYDNKTEFLFSYLQVMTAAFASFAHGSNDVANAIGPLAAVYEIWSKGSVGSRATVQVWMLAIGGIGIDLGLALYGWRVMINLGNNLTYHSPSRGFAMELGAALSVITASFLALPVSTTQCIVGATVGVGLCNGSFKSVNWRMVGWTCFGWLATLPIAGTVAGCLYAILTRGPSFNQAPVKAATNGTFF